MEGGSRIGVAGDSIIDISMGRWKRAEELEMLVDTKSKSLINVFTVRLVNHRLGKGFFCVASRLFDSFRNSECIILLLCQKPNFPKLRKAPRDSYVPLSSATCIGFFFWSRSICYVVGPSVRKRYRSW